MASAKVELARSIYTNWERGDFSSAEWADPEIELQVMDGPTPGSWTGPAGMREGWREFLSVWEGWRVEAEEYRELDDERVLVLGTFSGRGKVSGLDIGRMEALGANLLHIDGAEVTRCVIYWNRDRALADLGLAPQTRHPRP